MGKKIVTFIYDFDGTMLPGNAADQGLLPQLGCQDAKAIKDFWQESNALAKREKADKICAYMRLLVEKGREKGKPITKKGLLDHGARLELHEGLTGDDNWFDRIGTACEGAGMDAVHFVVSSGLAELVEGSSVNKRLCKVFGSRYMFGDGGEALWPAWTINYTTKTQYLYRINKGVLDESEDRKLNEFMDINQRPTPFERMVFIGDGYTDIPCFSLLRERGGHTLAVLDGKEKAALQQIETLVADNRVDAISLDDHFVRQSQLEKSVLKIISKITNERKLT